MSTFSKGHSKDYTKKKNMLQNNVPSSERARRSRLAAGDGILPKSKKWHEKAKVKGD